MTRILKLHSRTEMKKNANGKRRLKWKSVMRMLILAQIEKFIQIEVSKDKGTSVRRLKH